jgi:hypothetical protein
VQVAVQDGGAAQVDDRADTADDSELSELGFQPDDFTLQACQYRHAQ